MPNNYTRYEHYIDKFAQDLMKRREKELASKSIPNLVQSAYEEQVVAMLKDQTVTFRKYDDKMSQKTKEVKQVRITVTAAGFQTLVTDLQSLADAKKRMVDEHGSSVVDASGRYVYETVPVNKRSVSIVIKEVTEDSKYVVSVEDHQLDTLQTLRERNAAKDTYEAIA